MTYERPAKVELIAQNCGFSVISARYQCSLWWIGFLLRRFAGKMPPSSLLQTSHRPSSNLKRQQKRICPGIVERV